MNTAEAQAQLDAERAFTELQRALRELLPLARPGHERVVAIIQELIERPLFKETQA